MKKAILINANDQTIKEIEIADGLNPIYDAMGCKIFECVNLDKNNTLYIDEEGLLKSERKFWTYNDYMFVGSALILGFEHHTGNSISTNLTSQEVKNKIKFVSYEILKK
jgi:hypothetical protein